MSIFVCHLPLATGAGASSTGCFNAGRAARAIATAFLAASSAAPPVTVGLEAKPHAPSAMTRTPMPYVSAEVTETT